MREEADPSFLQSGCDAGRFKSTAELAPWFAVCLLPFAVERGGEGGEGRRAGDSSPGGGGDVDWGGVGEEEAGREGIRIPGGGEGVDEGFAEVGGDGVGVDGEVV